MYVLEVRKTLEEPQPADALAAFVTQPLAELGATTKLVVAHLFLSSQDVHDYFADLYMYGDRIHQNNGQLTAARAVLVSSGEIVNELTKKSQGK